MRRQIQAVVPYLSVVRQHAALAQEIAEAVEGALSEEDRWLPVQRLENELATYLRVKHVVAVGSGTDALTIALCALQLPPGTTVVTSAFGFFATVAAILRAGATPHFVDIDLKTFALDFEQALNRSTGRDSVFLPVHLFGFAIDLSRLLSADRSIIIEDAAQAFGAKREGRSAGTIGAVGALSFNWSKNLGTVGNGGALVTDDDEIASRARVLSNYGMSEPFTHTVVGLNSRLDPLEAAILSVKLRHVDAWNERRIAIAARYGERLASIPEVRTPKPDRVGTHVFHKYAILAEERDDLRVELAERGVETMVFYPLAQHRQPCLAAARGSSIEACPNADAAAKQIVCLPMFPELMDEEVDYVCGCVVDFYSRH